MNDETYKGSSSLADLHKFRRQMPTVDPCAPGVLKIQVIFYEFSLICEVS